MRELGSLRDDQERIDLLGCPARVQRRVQCLLDLLTGKSERGIGCDTLRQVVDCAFVLHAVGCRYRVTAKITFVVRGHGLAMPER